MSTFTPQYALEQPASTTQNKTSVYNSALARIDEGRRIKLVAAVPLPAHFLTYVTSGRLANLAHNGNRPLVGFVSSSGSVVTTVASGADVYTQIDGHIINSNWAFTPGLVIYAHPSQAGSITQTAPGSMAYPIAYAISSHQIGIIQGGFSHVMSFGPIATYAASNVVTDRTWDADNTTVAELADVVGTLVADLRALGLVL